MRIADWKMIELRWMITLPDRGRLLVLPLGAQIDDGLHAQFLELPEITLGEP